MTCIGDRTTMCPAGVKKTNHVLVASAMHNARGCKRPLALAAHDPAAAEQPAKRTTPFKVEPEVNANSSADAGALVPYLAPAGDSGAPIDAVPLATARPAAIVSAEADAMVSYMAPPKGFEPAMNPPEWIHELLLPRLNLRRDLPVIFVDEKIVSKTDLDPHQNRFRLPSDGVLRRLRSILTREQAAAARLLDEQARARRVAPPTPPPEDGNAGAAVHVARDGRKKKTGEKLGGLPVHMANRNLGVTKLQLARWPSSAGSVIKGEGYMDFIGQCGFKVDDLVEVWAFKQRGFWNFGVKMCDESPLYMVLVKKDGGERASSTTTA